MKSEATRQMDQPA